VKRLTVFFIPILFVACSNRSGVPGDVIPLDSMTVIMKDIILANEYSMTIVARDSLKKDKLLANQELLDGVFKIHHISRETFQNSMKFYDSRPDKNKLIFDSLAAYANRHKNEIYRPLKIPKAVPTPAK
jgi:hypothetical protein